MVVPSLNCTVPAAAAGEIIAVIVMGVSSTTTDSGVVASAVLVTVAPAITNVTAGDVDALYSVAVVGVNTAVSWRDPTANVVVVCVAVPLVRATAVPMLVAPSRNCTVPAAAVGVTVAVNVTVLPCTAGEAVEEALNIVLVAVGPEITKGTTGDVEGL